MSKSLITNLIAICLFLISFFAPHFPYQDLLLQISLFGLSGALTNWVAIYMLFEKVPGLYGSGIIPLRFESFKQGIRHLILNNFFTEENFKKFGAQAGANIDLKSIVKEFDFNNLFNGLIKLVVESKLGNMLEMFGGKAVLENLREPFIREIEIRVTDLADDPEVKKKISGKMSDYNALLEKVEVMVDSRLEELTPEMVKDIIQEMIRKHLGWLVIWGGVFGGLMGIITWFFINT